MKIGLILPTNLYYSPYINIYINILESNNILYDIISWDRESVGENKYIVFKRKSSFKSNNLKKIIDFIFFAQFVKLQIKKNGYDKLIIFGPQIGLLLYNFLNNRFKNKLIFDYRDLSIDQLFPKRFSKLLDISSIICISSYGFIKFLPNGYKYILSHNFDINDIRKKVEDNSQIFSRRNKMTKILTIGGIRDYDQNLELINKLKDNDSFYLEFIGTGIAEKSLKDYCVSNNIRNISFSGYYDKNEEPRFYSDSAFVNIYYPKLLSHETALSNRFYNSLIYKRPMIVTKNSIQGDIVEKNNLGIAISDCENIDLKLSSFIKDFNSVEFNLRCDSLLKDYENDYYQFHEEVINFLTSKC